MEICCAEHVMNITIQCWYGRHLIFVFFKFGWNKKTTACFKSNIFFLHINDWKDHLRTLKLKVKGKDITKVWNDLQIVLFLNGKQQYVPWKVAHRGKLHILIPFITKARCYDENNINAPEGLHVEFMNVWWPWLIKKKCLILLYVNEMKIKGESSNLVQSSYKGEPIKIPEASNWFTYGFPCFRHVFPFYGGT